MPYSRPPLTVPGCCCKSKEAVELLASVLLTGATVVLETTLLVDAGELGAAGERALVAVWTHQR